MSGAAANGPAANGPAATGAAANGPAANGPAANGPAANGPAANGPAANGPPAGRAGLVDERLAATADERRAEFRRVTCDRCMADLLVAKFSPQHTSVQWSPAAMRACEEFTARSAAGEQTALIDCCGSLRASIDRAVLEGRVEVAPP
jgi:hypothetical protein